MFVSILSYTYMNGSKSLYNIYFVPLETCNIKLIIESAVDLDWKVFSFSLEKTGHCLCVAFLISRGKTKRRKKKGQQDGSNARQEYFHFLEKIWKSLETIGGKIRGV